MKLRKKSNMEICEENGLTTPFFSNLVDECKTRNKIRATLQIIAKSIIGTLGPYGSTTLIQDRQMKHFASKDGYDLMNRISFDDEVARTILDIVRSITANQVLTVGDGTTSAVVIANALYSSLTDNEQIEYLKRIASKDVTDILNDLSEILEEEIKKIAVPISSDMSELHKIATVSLNNDPVAGKLIADTYKQIGKFGFITDDVIENYSKDFVEIKKGIEWKRGYIDPLYGKFHEGNKAIYVNNPRVIIFKGTVTWKMLENIVRPIVESAFNEEGAQAIIIANEYEPDAEIFFKANRTKHTMVSSTDVEFDYTPVDIDNIVETSRNKIEDLSLLCGCTIFDPEVNTEAEATAFPERFVGYANKVVVTETTTQIVANTPDKALQKKIDKIVKGYTDELNKEEDKLLVSNIDDTTAYNLKRRIANLTDSIALYHVGGKTFTERQTRERLIDDAILSCKSALDYGVIPGGNIIIPSILIDEREGICDLLGKKYSYLPIESVRVFFTYFINIIKESFLESYRAVLNNSYFTEEETEEVIEKCLREKSLYNLKTHEYEPFATTSVVNSAQTDIEILKTCISIIGILAMSNQVVTLNLSIKGSI